MKKVFLFIIILCGIFISSCEKGKNKIVEEKIDVEVLSNAKFYCDYSLEEIKNNLIVKVIYSDNTSKKIDNNNYTLSGNIPSESAKETFTVSYLEFNTNIDINFLKNDILQVLSINSKTKYYDLTPIEVIKNSIKIKVKYLDGSSGFLKISDYDVIVNYEKQKLELLIDGYGTYDLVTQIIKTQLKSISLSFDQKSNIITPKTSLDELKKYLTVNCELEDAASGEKLTLTDYTLSGELICGNSNITVTYRNKSISFSVNVTEYIATGIEAVFNQETNKIYNYDVLDDLRQYLTVYTYNVNNEKVETNDYTLSGDLTNEKSTIICSYLTFEDEFVVNVTFYIISNIEAIYSNTTYNFSTLSSIDKLNDYLVVKLHYTNGKNIVIEKDQYTISGTFSAGVSTFEVEYLTYKDTFDVNVILYEIDRFVALFTADEDITIYDDFTLNDIKQYVKAYTYNTYNEEAEISDFSLSGDIAFGTQTIKCSYLTYESSFTINVVKVELLSIDVIIDDVYKLYDYCSYSDIKKYLDVVAYYNNGKSKNLAQDEYSISGEITFGDNVSFEVSCNGKNKTIELSITKTEVVSINSRFNKNDNIITSYTKLDKLKNYLVVNLVYNDGNIVALDDEEYTLEGTLDSNLSTISAKYLGFRTSFNVAVDEFIATSIKVECQLTRIVYDNEEVESLKELIKVYEYNDALDERMISSELCELIGDFVEGKNTITCKYNGMATTFDVIVNASVISSISVDLASYIGTVTKYTKLDYLKQYLSGIINYTNSISKDLPIDECVLSGTLVVGTTQNITVNYKGFTDIIDDFIVNEYVATDIIVEYNPGDKIIYSDDELNVLKNYLTITLTNVNNEELETDNYELSGTLLETHSVIRVNVGSLSKTFTIDVVESQLADISLVLAEGKKIYTSTSIEDIKKALTVTLIYSSSKSIILKTDEYELTGSLEAGLNTFTCTIDESNSKTIDIPVNKVVVSQFSVFVDDSVKLYEESTLDDVKKALEAKLIYNDGSYEIILNTNINYTVSGTIAVGNQKFTVKYNTYQKEVTIKILTPGVISIGVLTELDEPYNKSGYIITATNLETSSEIEAYIRGKINVVLYYSNYVTMVNSNDYIIVDASNLSSKTGKIDITLAYKYDQKITTTIQVKIV